MSDRPNFKPGQRYRMTLDIEVEAASGLHVYTVDARNEQVSPHLVRLATFTLIEPPIKVGDVITGERAMAELPDGSAVRLVRQPGQWCTAHKENGIWFSSDYPNGAPLAAQAMFRVLDVGWGGDDE